MGLLDTYSGASRAWSVRRLRTAYSGACLRVRRASDNSEQDIGFVSDYLDVAAIASFCSGTDGFVTTVYGQDTTGFNATQTTQANQPRICASGVVDVRGAFAGFGNFISSQYFSFTEMPMGGGLDIASVFGVVFTKGAIAADPLPIVCGGNVTLSVRLDTDTTNVSSLFVVHIGQSDYFNSATFASNKLIQFSVLQNSSGVSGWVDGNLVGATASSSASFGLTSIGYDSSINTYYDDVMFEMVLYDTDEATDRSGIEADQLAYFTAATGANLTASQTLAGVTQTATAGVRASATATQTLAAVTQTATLKPRVSASATQTLQPVTQTATVRPRDSATATQTLAAVTQTATVRPRDSATASQTLAGVTQTASGDVDVKLNASQTLAPVTQVTSVSVGDARNITATQTLAGVTQTATARPIVAATATQTLQAVTQTATGDVDIKLSAAQTLAPVTQVTSVSVGDSRSLSANQTLQAVTQVASGDVDSNIASDQTLAGVTQTATAGVTFTISATQTLQPVTQTATLRPRDSATANQTIAGVTQTATSDTEIGLSANQTLQPVTQVAGDINVTLTASQTLEPISQVSIVTTGEILPNYKPSLSVDEVIDALQAFVLPFMRGGEVVRAQTNRVTFPNSPCATLKEILQVDIDTPYLTYNPNVGISVINGPQRIDIQIDFYGLIAGELCMAVKAAFRTVWASDQFPLNIKPLYTSDGVQSPLTTGEQQYESRWTLTASLQYNPIITVPQQFADVATVSSTDPVDVFEQL